MGNIYVVSTGSIGVSANAPSIPIEIAPASTQDAQMVALDITFGAVFSTTVPFIEFCTYGTVGSGGTTPTPTKYGENQGVPALTVVRINDTVAPTTIVSLFGWYYTGFSYLWPLSREFEMLASGKYCIRITSPSNSFACVNSVWVE